MAKDIKPPKMTVIPEKKTVKNEYGIEMSSKTHEIDPRPMFSISEKAFPEIKGWVVGQKYNLEIEVEQTAAKIADYGDDKGNLVADFRISGIMVDADADEKSEASTKKDTKEKYPKGMIKNKK